jgi:hypothetical protein
VTISPRSPPTGCPIRRDRRASGPPSRPWGRLAPGLPAFTGLSLLAIVCFRTTPAIGLDAGPVEPPGPTLAGRQEELTGRFRELERSLLRLADVLAATDPRRSSLLRRAFEQSSELDIDAKLSSIVGMLEEGRLLKAGSAQAGVLEQMRLLLDLLESGDSDRQLSNTKEEVKRFLARVSKAIAKQREIEGSTEAGGRTEELAQDQERLGQDAEALGADLGAFSKRMDQRQGGRESQNGSPGEDPRQPNGPREPEAPREADGRDGEPDGEGEPEAGEPEPPGEPEPNDSKPSRPAEQGRKPPGARPAGDRPTGDPGSEADGDAPADAAEGSPAGAEPQGAAEPQGDDESSRAARTQKRIAAAEARMRAAGKRLEEADRRGAREEQQKAIEELETARAELEEILRQVREEEVERLLAQLETRLRGMLRSERGILAGCERLAGQSPLPDPTDAQLRERELEAARLAREQAQVAADAGRALALVRDDGSAVAIPEALEQVLADCSQAAARLERADVGSTTRGLVQDVVASLQEILDALEKARRDEAEGQPPPQGGGRPASPGEQPLVDKLSELKMIRTLQMRINTRTRRYAQLLTDGVEQAEEPEIIEALRKLSVRQVKVERAARDIASGRTE